MAHERTGRWEEAETAYTAALSMQPGSMAAWQRLLLLAAATGRPHAIASVAARVSLPSAAWQALIPAALAAHRPEWLLRHAAALAAPLRAQPLAAGLALAQLGEDAAARAALQPWAAHAQHGPEVALALWALGHKQPGGRNARAAALPAAAHAAEALLQRGATAGSSSLACSPLRGAAPGGPTAPAPGGVLAAAQALAGVGAWAAWLRLLQALPPRGALALLAALPPAARCGLLRAPASVREGLLRAPASVREGLLALCGTPNGAQQPHADEVPASERTAHALLAGTLALLAGRQNLAREWAKSAQLTARQPAATGRPAKTIPPGLQNLLRLTAPGAAYAKEYTNQCNMLLVHL